MSTKETQLTPSEQELKAARALRDNPGACDTQAEYDAHDATIIAAHTRHEGKTAHIEQAFKRAESAEARVKELEAALQEARETNGKLQRRAQSAEGIIAKAGLVEGRPQGAHGRSLGRALANYTAEQYRRDRDELAEKVKELERERDELAARVKELEQMPCECATANEWLNANQEGED